MNARQRKKRRTKWRESLDGQVDHMFYCPGCGDKLDIKRNKYAIKYGTCHMHCYADAVGISLYGGY